ncbi:hypothetical protein OKW46_001453 [Paraburkholderia sp. WSM4179]|nr:hypothetical protein [Paraburkholderia sp. WSM4179]
MCPAIVHQHPTYALNDKRLHLKSAEDASGMRSAKVSAGVSRHRRYGADCRLPEIQMLKMAEQDANWHTSCFNCHNNNPFCDKKGIS